MNKLLLVDGATGTGKSDLMNFLKLQSDYDVSSIGKITTRKQRNKEEAVSTDLQFVSEEEFVNKVRAGDYYQYQYGENSENGKSKYALSKMELIDSLRKHEFTFAIVRSRPTIEQIIHELSQYGLVKRIFIHTDEEKTIQRLQRDGFTNEQIAFRIRRNKLLWDEEQTFDDNRIVIINNSNPEEFYSQIRELLNFYSKKHEPGTTLYVNGNTSYPLMSSLVGKKEAIVEQINRFPFEKNIFIMMKYRSSNLSIYNEIKRVIKEQGFNCVRADDPEWTFLTGDVDNYLAALYCCKYGIALFDKPEPKELYSPNVAYELGIMHCQKKKCLIFKHKSLDRIPFDFLQRLYKEYDDGTQIRGYLDEWINSIKREEHLL